MERGIDISRTNYAVENPERSLPERCAIVIIILPLTHILMKYTRGYKRPKSQEKINHLINMDIRLLTKNKKESKTLIQAVSTYTDDVGMWLGIRKCVKLIMKSG